MHFDESQTANGNLHLICSTIYFMIQSAEEFIKLRESDVKEEQHRASNDEATLNVWMDVINKYPTFKTWVIHNKTVPLEILELLSHDPEPDVRSAVAGKRKISESIFNLLSTDPDELVRYALMCNTKITSEKLKTIQVDDSEWLVEKLEERLIEVKLESEGTE